MAASPGATGQPGQQWASSEGARSGALAGEDHDEHTPGRDPGRLEATNGGAVGARSADSADGQALESAE
ncbi:hypothetical protein GGH92_006092 [Coemansia sp. RSA 2673]|nr:hypothetical protein GGH13_003858 [Coemansia sp. S155-1]KAJ2340822.1 hypothetical protein GGH92_006092 [Coemansia sp. RSA 2673]